MKINKWYIIIGSLFMMSTIAFIIVDRYSKERSGLSNTTQPSIRTIIVSKYISGNLYPMKEIEIKSPISGVLEEYYVKIGDRVKIGDNIAKIRIIPEAAQVDNARKNAKTAYIQYKNNKNIYITDSVLHSKQVISKYDFETSRTNYLLSKENYISAQNQLALIEGSLSYKSNISNIVKAISAGIITDIPIEEGTSVMERSNYSEGTSIAQIAQLDSFLFKGKVIENDVLALKHGMEIVITPTSFDTMRITAVIQKISTRGKVDQGIMKYDIEAIFKCPKNMTLYSGFNAIAEIILDKRENVLSIPEKYIIFEQDSTFVMLLKNKKMNRTRVKTGISNGIYIEIINGIKDTDKITI